MAQSSLLVAGNGSSSESSSWFGSWGSVPKTQVDQETEAVQNFLKVACIARVFSDARSANAHERGVAKAKLQLWAHLLQAEVDGAEKKS